MLCLDCENQIRDIPSALLRGSSFYSNDRNRRGALGRVVVGYFGKNWIASRSEHFHRDPVVISQGIKRLEQKLKDEKGLQKSMDRIEKSLKRNNYLYFRLSPVFKTIQQYFNYTLVDTGPRLQLA